MKFLDEPLITHTTGLIISLSSDLGCMVHHPRIQWGGGGGGGGPGGGGGGGGGGGALPALIFCA